MSYTVAAMIFNLYLLILKGQTLNLSQDNEMQPINATVGDQVLFSTNCSPCINQTIEWKYLSDPVKCLGPNVQPGVNVYSIAMKSPNIYESTVFGLYKARVELYTNSSLELRHIQLNDSGCYTLTITDAAGNIVTLRKLLSVFEAETSKPHIDGKNSTDTSEIPEENVGWKNIGIIIGAIVSMAFWALFVVAIGFFIKKRIKGSRLDDEKTDEFLSNDNPMVVYSTFVGGFNNFGKALQNASLSET